MDCGYSTFECLKWVPRRRGAQIRMSEQIQSLEPGRSGGRAIALAVLASLALHASAFSLLEVLAFRSRPPAPLAARLQARIAPLPAPPAAEYRGDLVKNTIERERPSPPRQSSAHTPPARQASAEPAKRPPAKPLKADVLKGKALAEANQKLSQVLFYPEEAVRLGLEGEAIVYIDLDASGSIVAAEIAKSSGHAILDQAALRAVRAIGRLGGAADQAVLMPVRFQLVSE